MSKSLLIGAVRQVLPEIPSDAAKEIVGNVLETITRELVAQGGFILHEIGSLRLEHKPARRGRNPANGEQITIPARTVVRYRASSVLTDRINAGRQGVNRKKADQSSEGAGE